MKELTAEALDECLNLEPTPDASRFTGASNNHTSLMPTTTTLAKEHQERWQELCRDPSLNDLPYKTETNERGQLILTPISNRRSWCMASVMGALDKHGSEGSTPPSYAIATPGGVKVPDVVWMSLKRREEMDKTGDPTTLAPEICVDVMTPYNSEDEMRSKHELYLAAGAEEVWVVGEDGSVRFFGQEEMESSELIPKFPEQL